LNYEIVKYTPEFKRQVVELQTGLWGPDLAVNTACLEWKHEQNPFIDSPCIYLALCDGRVVAMRGIFGALWQSGRPRRTWPGPCGCDFVIAPEHRERGLFTRLVRASLEDLAAQGYPYVFSLSAGSVTYLSLLAMGWRGTGPTEIMQRRSDSAAAEKSFGLLDRNGLNRGDGWPHVSLSTSAKPDAMTELTERIGGDGRIRHVRDRSYFSWRFRNPLSEYRFLFWEADRLEGYLVLRRSASREKPAINVADWEAADARVWADLLEAAVQWGHFQYLTIWSSGLPQDAKHALRENGFGPVPPHRYAPTVLIRPTNDGLLESHWDCAGLRLLDARNWDLRMIDSDGC
jgi:hypothetical protein